MTYWGSINMYDWDTEASSPNQSIYNKGTSVWSLLRPVNDYQRSILHTRASIIIHIHACWKNIYTTISLSKRKNPSWTARGNLTLLLQPDGAWRQYRTTLFFTKPTDIRLPEPNRFPSSPSAQAWDTTVALAVTVHLLSIGDVDWGCATRKQLSLRNIQRKQHQDCQRAQWFIRAFLRLLLLFWWGIGILCVSTQKQDAAPRMTHSERVRKYRLDTQTSILFSITSHTSIVRHMPHHSLATQTKT